MGTEPTPGQLLLQRDFFPNFHPTPALLPPTRTISVLPGPSKSHFNSLKAKQSSPKGSSKGQELLIGVTGALSSPDALEKPIFCAFPDKHPTAPLISRAAASGYQGHLIWQFSTVDCCQKVPKPPLERCQLFRVTVIQC